MYRQSPTLGRNKLRRELTLERFGEDATDAVQRDTTQIPARVQPKHPRTHRLVGLIRALTGTPPSVAVICADVAVSKLIFSKIRVEPADV